mmetsp:Transcript_16647/g.35819  ORF Transcript_16647/g.35819 Transcript_16647/m.35819 type:complete len:119 (+) Transcript_16647:35-391(+)
MKRPSKVKGKKGEGAKTGAAGVSRIAAYIAGLAVLLCVVALAMFMRSGVDEGACGQIEVDARPGATSHMRTVGHLGPDATAGSSSSVKLSDRFGTYEVSYEVPEKCGPNQNIIIFHYQ